MKYSLVVLVIFTIILLGACSKKTGNSKSAAELPKEKATLYTADVLPLIQAKCSPCHLPTKGGFKADFENHESAKKFGAEMLVRVQLNPGEKGFMPFKNAKLSAEEIAVFKKWLNGGML